MVNNQITTSESVSEGHPDKVADRISDSILDEMLRSDENSRVACETFVTKGLVLIGGEVKTKSYINLQDIVRKEVKDIGYIHSNLGFYYADLAVLNVIHEQSVDIAQGVNQESPELQGAGDQGSMFGYAIDHTSEYMPLPISLSHDLMFELTKLRKSNKLSYLRPDSKSQVSILYKNGKPMHAEKIVIATQHTEEVSQEKILEDLNAYLIESTIGEYFTKDTKVIVNGTGKFVKGGPAADVGLTGRKIIVDTYGGVGYHGGGAFSGKDPSKVDRSGSYAARYIAKNIVANGYASEVDIQIAYAIGIAEPFSFNINSKGTGTIPDSEIKKKVIQNFDLRPGKIIERFDLKKPIYKATSTYGHFGRKDLKFPWEKLDLF